MSHMQIVARLNCCSKLYNSKPDIYFSLKYEDTILIFFLFFLCPERLNNQQMRAGSDTDPWTGEKNDDTASRDSLVLAQRQLRRKTRKH